MVVLSGRWPGLLLYYLKDGTKRFSDLRRDNPTISHRMLTQELRKLEAAGIVRRTAYRRLSPAGRIRPHARRPRTGASHRCIGRLVEDTLRERNDSAAALEVAAAS